MMKRVSLWVLICAALAVSIGFNQAGKVGVPPVLKNLALDHSRPAHAVNALADLPLYFVENRGQTNEAVKYVLQTQRGSVFFTPREIVFQFVVPQNGGTAYTDPIPPPGQEKSRVVEDNLHVQFLGSRQDVRVDALSECGAQISYFRGRDPEKWVRGARSYEKLLYSNLYPGIDLVTSGQAGKLKNEYIVRPGGEPTDITIRYHGAAGIEINDRGQLEIGLSTGKLIEDAPECYQEIDGRRVSVEAAFYVENGNTVRIDVADYRKDAELIIDPIIYATFLGSSDIDYGVAMDTDDSGNVYVAGFTASTNFPTTGGAYDTTYNGGTYDFFVSKFNPSLSTLLYSTYLGGSGNETGGGLTLDLAVDDSGNAYLTGYTDSTDFPTSPGAYDTTHNGGTYDAFVTKINPAGSALVFSTYLGGNAADYGYIIATDETGSIVGVAGSTFSANFPTTGGAYDTSHNGGSDGFLVVMNSSGTGLIYSTFFGGTGTDIITDLGADNSGNVYLTGYTDSTDFPTSPGAYDTTYSGGLYDGYVAKLDSSFTSLVYLTYLGGSGEDRALSMKINEYTGELFVTGRTSSTDFPVTFGVFDTSYNGGAYDAFVTKINASGTALLYSTYLGGSDNDGVHSIASEKDKTAVVAGYTFSTDFPTTSDGTDRTYNGGVNDIFVCRLSRLGTDLIFSTYVGGNSNEGLYKILSADFGNYLIFGFTASANFPATPGAYDTSINGAADAFALMISVPIEIYANMIRGDFDGDGADEAAVDFGALGAWVWDSGAWNQLTSSDPEGMVAADIDGDAEDEIVADMGTLGLWVWNGRLWTQLSGVNVGGLAVADVDGSGDDEVVGDFSTVGLWLWDSGVWTQLSGVNADRAYTGDVDGNGDKEIVGDFGATGLWLWDSGVWTQLSGVDADQVCFAETDGSAGEELAVDFGATGLWLWDSGAWAQLSGANAETVISGDLDGSGDDEIAADFGHIGLWLWNGGVWAQISNLDAIQMISADTDGSGDDELIVDFGFMGLWMYDGGAWSQMSPTIPQFLIAADVDGNGDDEILVDFGDIGLWLWNGGAWNQISPADPD
jgi:hypothetical protein